MAPAANQPLVIDAIEVTPVVVPLHREYRGSNIGMQTRATVITRITTSDGVVGEAYAADEAALLTQIVSVISDEIAPRLIGQNALSYERWWELGYPATFDQLRDRRIGLVALASVDFALWDAIGKTIGQPLWRLWGGYRSELPINMIGGYYGRDLAGIRDEVTEWREMGFRGCKFKVGGRSPAEDADRVRAVRTSAGSDFVITVDANQGYTLQEAHDFCRRVEELNIRWFEEPCRWSNDHRDMREVRSRSRIPICAGQSEHSPGGCRDMMEHGAIDVCNFDASWSGGYTSWRLMAALARVYSVELAHHEEPHIGAHLLASQPHSTYLEVFHPDRDPIWWQMIVNRPEVVEGTIALPQTPGLGWELDEDFIERYRIGTPIRTSATFRV